MAILCLLLGLLCVVGFGSSQDTATATARPTAATPSQPTTVDVPKQPTTVVAATKQPATVVAPTKQPTTVAATKQPTTAATNIVSPAAATVTPPVATTRANTSPNILTTVKATISVPQSGTITTLSNGAPTGPQSSITSAQVTNKPESPSTVTKQATVPVTVKPTGPSIVSTRSNLIASQPGPSKGPEGTGTTEPPQLNAKTDSNSAASPTATKMPPQSLDTEPPKGTDRHTPALGSSESPSPRMTSSSIAGGILDAVTTKSVIPHPRSGSSSVPATSPELTTRKDIESQMTAEVDKARKLKEKNIEVKCANITNEKSKSYVRLATGGSAICDNGEPTEGERTTEDLNAVLMHVCKAIKPGYQENQDKCIVRLARINANDLAITEAFIESHLQPKELYTQMKKNGANSKLFSFDGAEPEDEDVVSIPLISAIVSLAVLLLIIAAAYGCWHQRKARKREQRLTEELQTMENGYHDNPTLEVMETSPEMQEKKGGPNGELGDSWIVPLDNLTREDLEEEEDTHL